MLKFGTVTKIDAGKARAVVRFNDSGTLSDWLVIMQKGSYKTRGVELPDIGEEVVCLTDDNLEDGCILGSYYTDANPAAGNTDIIIKEALNSFKILINKLLNTIDLSFKIMTLKLDMLDLQITSALTIATSSLKINGVDLIGLFNSHTHTGNLSAPTSPPERSIPNAD